jgi:hypothetical protein
MSQLLPLEQVFERKAADKSSFPRHSEDYIAMYKNMVDHLRKNFYPKIDVGLAANSKNRGIYTFHDGNHFDEVVRFAGYLLGVRNGHEDVNLSAYELYILLVAIRVHDVGNIEGREDHEKKCFDVLREMQSISGPDNSEKKMIANVAQAHGGKTPSGDRDTIGALQKTQDIAGGQVRLQLLASLLRFADEACDSRGRVLTQAQIPTQNEIYHAYAASIIPISYSFPEKRLNITYEIKLTEVSKEWGKEEEKIYLADYILDRLTKMDQERRYCNKYLRELSVDEIRASVKVIDESHEDIIEIKIPELRDAGYPGDDPNQLKEKLKDICGNGLEKKIKQREEDTR